MFRFLVAAFLVVAFPAWAQDAPMEPVARPAAVTRANAGTVGVIAGGVDGTYIRIAADLAAVLDDGDRLRVLALLGRGSEQNLRDIMFLRGIDIGIVQSDVLAFTRRDRTLPGVAGAVQYIAKLYDEEVHVLARREVGALADLAGKKVNVDVRGSGTAMTASLLFDLAGVAVEAVHDDQATALAKLRAGEIDAMVYVAGKPARLFAGLDGAGLHFVPVAMTPVLLETYLPATLGAEAYPGLVAEGAPVETVAVGAVMAVYAWPPGHERYRKVAAFVAAFFDRFEAFRRAPRHPKWREVNIAAQVPGWRRFPAAQEWLDRQRRTAER
jgi:TRAP transporter TAXI family solute receptor